MFLTGNARAEGEVGRHFAEGWTRKEHISIPAFVITDGEITDASLYGQFLERVTSTVETHGDKFVARGGELEVILGDWTPRRLEILEFDNLQQIRTWLNSPEYTALNDIRSRSSNINMVIVEGL